MKVVNVDFVENEMVELDVAQIGLNWGWGEDESEFGDVDGGDACGDGYAKIINLATIPPPSHSPSPHPIPNQSKPIVLPISHYLL